MGGRGAASGGGRAAAGAGAGDGAGGGKDARRALDARIAAASLPADWWSRTWLALDFETTGLSPSADRVVEVGALRFRLIALDGESAPVGSAGGLPRLAPVEEGSLSLLVDPGMPIPALVTGIHGIRDEDVAGAPSFASAAPALLELCEGAIVIAHNAPFDLGFLRAELVRAGLPPFAGAWADTRLLARAAFPGLPGYGLGDLARRFGIDTGRAHRALDDARACMGLFLAAAPLVSAARAFAAGGAAGGSGDNAAGGGGDTAPEALS